jgi:hypothetical protein
MSHGQKYCVRFREGLIARGKEGVSRLFALIRAHESFLSFHHTKLFNLASLLLRCKV